MGFKRPKSNLENGGKPQSRMYAMTPTDQMSTFRP